MDRLIIFNWGGVSVDNQLSPYSERVLKILPQKYELAIISKINFKVAEIRILNKKLNRFYFEVYPVNASKISEQYGSCIKEFSLKPEDTIIVGNGPVEEIDAGRNLGCDTYCIPNNGFESREHKIINSIGDLLTKI